MNGLTSRLGGVCASLFAIFFLVGVIFATDVPDGNADDSKFASYVNDNGKLIQNIIGTYLVIAAGLLLLIFLAYLYQRLRAAPGGNGVWSLVALTSGVTFAGCTMIGAILVSIVAAAIKFGPTNHPSPELARWIPQAGFGVMFVVGGPVGALMSATIASLILRTRVLPAWLGYTGFLAALGMLGSVVFVPMILFVLWMFALGIVLAIRSEPPVPTSMPAKTV